MIRIICVIILLQNLLIASGTDTLRLGVGLRYGSPGYNAAKEIYEEISMRTGYTIDLIPIPYAQEELELQAGLIDGGAARTDQAIRSISDVIMIPQHFFTLPAYVFAGPNIQGESTKYLQGFTAVIPVGEFFSISFLSEHGLSYITVPTLENISPAICSGLADYTIAAGIFAKMFTAKNDTCTALTPWSKPVIYFDIYCYLHKRHSSKVEYMTKAITEMYTSGLIRTILRKHMSVE